MPPVISVIIPVYNTEKYLKRCVDSVLQQTYRNLEIILIDDGSTDDSPHFCDWYKTQDPRIQVIHKKNGGLSSARNAGLELVSGDYIGFVDSDDWIDSNMYESLLHAVQENNTLISRCDIIRTQKYEEKESLDEYTSELLDNYAAIKTIWTNGFMCNKLFARECFFDSDDTQKFDENIFYVEDSPVLAQCIFKSGSMAICTGTAYHYFIHEGTLTNEKFNYKQLTCLIGFRRICDMTRIYAPDLLDYNESKYFTICMSFMLNKEVKSKKTIFNKMKEEIKKNIRKIIRLRNMQLKFKCYALLICIYP